MEYPEAAIQAYFDAAEQYRQIIDDEAKEKAREHLFNAAQDPTPLHAPNGNPYEEGTWQNREYEAAYNFYMEKR